MAIELPELNPEQQRAVTHGEGPLLILAGAGSGKTRVITCRIAWLIAERGVAADNILAVTFTNKAASEMRERVDRLAGRDTGAWISTFHSFGARILRRHADRVGFGRDFVVYDADDSKRLGREVLAELKLDPAFEPVEPLLRRVEAAKHGLKAPGEGGLIGETARRFYARYTERLLRANALDFADLIFLTHRLWRKEPELLERYRERFAHVLVDEFQDTDRAQYGLLRLLCGPRSNLCVVGDDDQSIYTWRDADVGHILGFERDYPGCEVIRLEQNYRSTKKILAAAATVIAKNSRRHAKTLWTAGEEGEEVRVERLADERAEAELVARDIHLAAERGEGLAGAAVFYRVNAQSRALEEFFRLYGLPYVVVGGTRFFDRKEIRDVVAYLRLANNPASDVDALRVINVPPRGIGRRTSDRLVELAREREESLFATMRGADLGFLRRPQREAVAGFVRLIEDLCARAGSLTAAEIIPLAVELSDYLTSLESEEERIAEARRENLDELVTAAWDHAELSGDSSLGEFLQHVALVSAADLSAEGADAVSLMTLHAAKGLEFDRVYMVGLEEGLLPHYRVLEGDPGDGGRTGGLAEERRLCYVGMTRARKRLVLSSVTTRNIFGRSDQNPPSRFLDELYGDREDEELLQPRLFAAPVEKRPPFAAKGAAKEDHVYDMTDIDLDDDDEVQIDYSDEFNQSPGGAGRPAEGREWVGRAVAHPSFGRGRVLGARRTHGGVALDIEFEGLGRKTIMARYVKLE